MFDGVTDTTGFCVSFNAPSGCASGGEVLLLTLAANTLDGVTGDAGGNLNSLFIDPFRLFRFSDAVLLVVLSRLTLYVSGSASSFSSTVGSLGLTLAEGGWLTKALLGGAAEALDGGGMEARTLLAWFGGGLAGELGSDACDMDCGLLNVDVAGVAELAPR